MVCSICLECFTCPGSSSEGGIYATKCGHVFHVKCFVPLISWNEADRIIKCPLCRHYLRPLSCIKLFDVLKCDCSPPVAKKKDVNFFKVPKDSEVVFNVKNSLKLCGTLLFFGVFTICKITKMNNH